MSPEPNVARTGSRLSFMLPQADASHGDVPLPIETERR